MIVFGCCCCCLKSKNLNFRFRNQHALWIIPILFKFKKKFITMLNVTFLGRQLPACLEGKVFRVQKKRHLVLTLTIVVLSSVVSSMLYISFLNPFFYLFLFYEFDLNYKFRILLYYIIDLNDSLRFTMIHCMFSILSYKKDERSPNSISQFLNH